MTTPTQTDKIGHGYGPVYERLFGSRDTFTLIEIGIAGGDGCRWFAELYPQAHILGVDIDRTRTNPVGPTVHADARDPELAELVAQAIPANLAPAVGLVVDDGAHTPDTIVAAFRSLWPLLLWGGVYVVEDWNHANGIGLAGIQELVGTVTGAGEVDTLTLHRTGLAVFRKGRLVQ